MTPAVKDTPIVAAAMAAMTERPTSFIQSVATAGTEMTRIPIATTAASARTPNRRITGQGYRWPGALTGPSGGTGPQHPVVRSPTVASVAVAGCYTPPVLVHSGLANRDGP